MYEFALNFQNIVSQIVMMFLVLRYDENKKSMDHGYPRKIVSDFGKIGRVDAAFQKDGKQNMPLIWVYLSILASVGRSICFQKPVINFNEIDMKNNKYIQTVYTGGFFQKYWKDIIYKI